MIEFSIQLSPGKWIHYEVYKLLGAGTFGEVYEAWSSGTVDSLTGEITGKHSIAIKFLKRERDKELLVINEMPESVFDCPNLTRYRAYHFATRAFSTVCKRYTKLGVLIMDVAHYGSAIDWVARKNFQDRRNHFPIPIARRIICDLILCLASLKEEGVCHRDLKGDNVFIDGRGRFILGDLGHAKIVPKDNQNSHTAIGIGSKASNPPELTDATSKRSRYDTEKVDVWGLGVFLFTLISGINIWNVDGITRDLLDTDERIKKKNVRNDQFWNAWKNNHRYIYCRENFDDCTIKFLNRLLSYCPKNRPTFQELYLAMRGDIIDDSLLWLSSTEVCTISELETELNQRIPNVAAKSVHFFQPKLLWKKVRNVTRAFTSSKKGSISHSEPNSDSIEPSNSISDGNDETVSTENISSSTELDSGESEQSILDTDESFNNFIADNMNSVMNSGLPAADLSASPILCWSVIRENRTDSISTGIVVEAHENSKNNDNDEVIADLQPIISLLIQYLTVKLKLQVSGATEGTTAAAGATETSSSDKYYRVNVLDQTDNSTTIDAELLDDDDEIFVKFSVFISKSSSELLHRISHINISEGVNTNKALLYIQASRIVGDLIFIKTLLESVMASLCDNSTQWNCVFIGNAEPSLQL
jgi:serine/threonine protein kinase